MDVCVVGLGRLGTSLAVAMADTGIQVTGVDINPDVVDAINIGKPHIYEPGLKEALYSVRRNGNLSATSDLKYAVRNSRYTIILVPTPSDSNGAFSNEYVLEVCRELVPILRELNRRHTVIISSTVMPESCAGVIWDTLGECGKMGKSIGLCYCPEFIALGNALEGFKHPDFVLVGASDERAGEDAWALYHRFCDNNPPIIVTSLINAEIAKIALNFFLTIKISMGNVLAEICECLPGADVDEVTDILGMDSRIAQAYLTGATAAGGPCFPRDIRSMQALSSSLILLDRLPNTIRIVNEWQKERLAWKIIRLAEKRPNKKIGILGLAFKPGTDVINESTGIYLKNFFGWDRIVAYDPLVKTIQECPSAQECVDQAGVVVITTPDPEFRKIRARRKQVIVDCWRILDREQVGRDGAEYVGIGLGGQNESR